MLFRLPDHKTLYTALIERDQNYDGRAYVGVITTGIFCRLTCPARKPKTENCTFFDSVAGCMDAGFRPCKRCHPLRPATSYDPSTVRRSFKRQFGMTFLELARMSRIKTGFKVLSAGGRVIEAQFAAGFDSPSAFRAAFAKLLGQTPSRFTGKELLKADWIDTPIGALIAISDSKSLHLLEFVDRKALPSELKRLQERTKGGIGIGRFGPVDQLEAELAAYFRGENSEFTVPLAPYGSPFAKEVWRELRKIPPGQTRSYGELAKTIGRPAASRAVARANGANQIALVIPCHRVIGADGALTGYGGGLWRKQYLIDLEQNWQTLPAIISVWARNEFPGQCGQEPGFATGTGTFVHLSNCRVCRFNVFDRDVLSCPVSDSY